MTTLPALLAVLPPALRLYLTQDSDLVLVLITPEGTISDGNRAFIRLFDLSAVPHGRPLSDFFVLPERTDTPLRFTCHPARGVHASLAGLLLPASDGMLLLGERPMVTEPMIAARMGEVTRELIAAQHELTRRHLQLEATRRELAEKVAALEQALGEVKRLEGLLPICMYCKKIRDEVDTWQPIEEYITHHCDADFSHGICPDCFEREHGDLARRRGFDPATLRKKN